MLSIGGEGAMEGQHDLDKFPFKHVLNKRQVLAMNTLDRMKPH